ncbi:MAG: HAD hydrolase family protein [Lachnospiraceae bacterium]|nr:HAD hydrolase family protein [Lachnospiraceae bacterium]
MPEIQSFNQITTRLSDFKTAATVTTCIKQKFGDMLNPLQNDSFIDIVKVDMNKAKGLYILTEYLGAEYDDVIAVGDNINDSDMIKEFKSYAMENGVDVIKELADYVTPGITELIEKELVH